MHQEFIVTMQQQKGYPFGQFYVETNVANFNHGIQAVSLQVNPSQINNNQSINKCGRYKTNPKNIPTLQEIHIRRISKYNSEEQYFELKEKIDVLKKLKDNANMVRLINVLEGENNFHLIYEYINSGVIGVEFNEENVKNVQQMLGSLFETFAEMGIGIKQQCNNRKSEEQRQRVNAIKKKKVGFNEHCQIKYYLDIDDFYIYKYEDIEDLNQINAQYASQIETILRDWYHSKCSDSNMLIKSNQLKNQQQIHPKNNLPLPVFPNNSYSTIPPKRTNSSSSSSSSIFSNLNSLFPNSNHPNQSSKQPLKFIQSNKKINNPLQVLNMIQTRLQQLKRTTKYNPKMRQTFQMKQILRETVKQKWQKQKIQNRKMSGDTVYDNKNIIADNSKNNVRQEFVKQENNNMETKTSRKNSKFHNQYPTTSCFPSSQPKNLTLTTKTIPIPTPLFSNAILSNNNNSNPNNSPSQASVNNISKNKNGPTSKKDFEQMKKSSFQKFTTSKQKYVQQFLDILGDDNQNKNWEYNHQVKPVIINQSNNNNTKSSQNNFLNIPKMNHSQSSKNAISSYQEDSPVKNINDINNKKMVSNSNNSLKKSNLKMTKSASSVSCKKLNQDQQIINSQSKIENQNISPKISKSPKLISKDSINTVNSNNQNTVRNVRYDQKSRRQEQQSTTTRIKQHKYTVSTNKNKNNVFKKSKNGYDDYYEQGNQQQIGHYHQSKSNIKGNGNSNSIWRK